MQDKSTELKVAIRAALEAGKILEWHQETEIKRGVKEDKSMVTLADTESEELIKRIISEKFPDHSIIGEETDPIIKEGSYTWYVDPVDGSRNFAHQIPFFAISISLICDEKILVGVVYNPATRALFYAETGKGPDLKIRRNLLRDLPERVVSSVRDFGCTALDLAFVARCSTEADIKSGFKTYDA